MADDKKGKEKEKEQKGNHRGMQPSGGGTLTQQQPRGGSLFGGGFDPFFRLREEFSRLFDPFFSGGLMEMPRPQGWGLNVDENDREVIVNAEAPGFEPQDFDIQVQGDHLVLSGSKHTETEEKEGGHHEWRQQELYRSLTLPHGVAADKVEAEYHNGILTIKLPKTEESKGRRIEVKAK